MTIFAKRHYEAIAETLRCQTRHQTTNETYARIVCDFAAMFTQDNGKFKQDIFIRACYPKDSIYVGLATRLVTEG